MGEMSIPPSRAKAKALRQPHYFTGKPCKNGHVEFRHVGNGECVECARLRAARWGRTNSDKVAKKNSAYYLANKENENTRCRVYKAANREDISEYNAAYRIANLGHIQQRERQYWRNNSDRAREWNRQFHLRNPHQNAEYHDRRRARNAAAEGYYTSTDLARIRAAQNGRCTVCRSNGRLTVDHILPLSQGGSNWPANLQFLCKSCNSSKRARDPIEFMQSRGFLL